MILDSDFGEELKLNKAIDNSICNNKHIVDKILTFISLSKLVLKAEGHNSEGR